MVSPFSRMEECVEVMLATRTVAGGAVPISKVRLRTAVLTGSGALSMTVYTTVASPAVSGVPESVRVSASNTRPAGSVADTL